MVAGRWAKLAAAAAASGRLDFNLASSQDWKWLARERIVLNEIESCNTVQLASMASLRIAAIASGWPEHDSEGKMAQISRSLDFFRMAGKGLLPYMQWDERDARKTEMSELRKEYVRQFGDPNDPKFQVEMAKLQKTLQQQAEDNKRRAEAEVARDAEWQKKRIERFHDRHRRAGKRQ